MKGERMMRIIVELKGGLVQAVWSTDQTIAVEIMNRDTPENDEDADEYVQEITQLEAEIRNLNMMDIS
jgi:cell division protein FtsB